MSHRIFPSCQIPEEPCSEFAFRQATQRPGGVAIRFGAQVWTFGDLANAIWRARNLLGADTKPGQRVILALGNDPRYIAWAIAAIDLSLVVAPLYPNAPIPEIRQKCELAKPVALIVADHRVDGLLAAGLPEGVKVVAASASDFTTAERGSRSRLPQADDWALLAFSSGSTGQPKAIPLTHRNVVAGRSQFCTATATAATDRLAHFLPLTHIYGWMAATSILMAGGELILHERYDFDAIVGSIAHHQATALFGVPQTLLDLKEAPASIRQRLSSLRFVNTGSAPLAPEVMRDVARKVGVLVTTGYGLTEAAPLSHSPVLHPELVDCTTVGYPVPHTAIKIVDPNDPAREVARTAAGELLVSGPQVAQGYLDSDGLIDRSSWLADGFFRTGDLVERDAAGRLRIVGRLKNIIKYKGYSIAPAELEGIIAEHPSVADCAVLGKPDEVAGELPVAFVVRREGTKVEADDLTAFLRGRISPQKNVRMVRFVEAIPRSQAGKVLASQLLELV